MARRKKPKLREQKSLPDWTKAIQELREALGGGTQEKFAGRLRSKQCTVSTWLRGDENRKPSADSLIRMAGLAPNPDLASRFLRLAKISDEAIFSVARKLETDRFREAVPLVEKGEIVLVPRYRYTAQGREEAGPPVPLPAEFIPNQRSTICVVVDEAARGIVNAPRGTFIVDTSVEEAQELTQLWEKAVLLDFQLEDRSFRKGIYAGHLRLDRRISYVGRAGELAKQASLDMLTRRAFASLPLGEWRHPSFDELRFETIVGTDGVGRLRPPTLEETDAIERLERETEERAPVEFRLPNGIRIIGQVIGRLSGNVK